LNGFLDRIGREKDRGKKSLKKDTKEFEGKMLDRLSFFEAMKNCIET
jgi:hypothetical protein